MRAWLLVWLMSFDALAACPPDGWTCDALQRLKAEGFAVAEDSRRAALARGLAACLADPDPAVRDGIAFEAYAHWLRSDRLDEATRRDLLQSLTEAARAPDPRGFGRPFAVLVLSEVARTDRIAPWLSTRERSALVDTATDYVRGVADHRGFVDGEGWRHGVAHGADLLMQLALNPALERAQLDAILAAVAAQVRPSAPYVHGESERLARPVLFVAARGLHSAEAWSAWFEELAAPAPLPDWNAAFASEKGLAQRHNLLAFLRALYVASAESGDDQAQALLPPLRGALKTLP